MSETTKTQYITYKPHYGYIELLIVLPSNQQLLIHVTAKFRQPILNQAQSRSLPEPDGKYKAILICVRTFTRYCTLLSGKPYSKTNDRDSTYKQSQFSRNTHVYNKWTCLLAIALKVFKTGYRILGDC